MKNLKEAVLYIQERIAGFVPESGIILGTGLGALINDVTIDCSIDYKDIPHFPVSTVEFHSGKLHFGTLEGKRVVVMQGRLHFYEGYSMQEVVFPVRVLKRLGIEKLFVSNAAGGISESFELSDLMVINDHINLMPGNPLIGPNLDELGPRWPDMFDAYDKSFIARAMQIGEQEGFSMHQGVYASVPGPNLETPAEYKYL